MTPFLFLCLILAVAGLDAHNVHMSAGDKEKALQYSMQCVKETGVKPDVLAEAKKGHLADDEALKHFILCFFQKAGVVDNKGNLNVDVALAKLPAGVEKPEAKKVLEDCKGKTGKTPADKTFEIFKCYSKGAKQHVVL